MKRQRGQKCNREKERRNGINRQQMRKEIEIKYNEEKVRERNVK